MPMANWRDDIDALQFAVGDNGLYCMIHRLAFRRLLGFTPDKHDCLAWFAAHHQVFLAAAGVKLAMADNGRACNIHINSRDVTRQMRAADL